jgi:REP element-mobilizing transposase RayT
MAVPIRYPERGSQRLRQGRRSETGRIYLVTFTTVRRVPVFACWEAALAAARAFHMPETWADSRLLCWVLMPDHWHGLVELGAGSELSALIRRVKGVTSRKVNQACGRRGALWAQGFHDHALRSEERTVDVARYIVLNPVRAGLVARLLDYPFWNAAWLEQEHRG